MTDQVQFGVEHECAACRAKPGAPQLCELCLRRLALKVGERITDPALLAVGMRVYTGVRPSGFDRVIARVSEWGVTFADGGQFGNDSIQRGRQDWERVTFRDWAQGEKSGAAQCSYEFGDERCGSKAVADGRCWNHHPSAFAKRAKSPAGKPDPTPTGLTAEPPPLCNAEQCGFHHDPSDPACVRAKHRTPAPPPKALPFKRHPGCYMPSIHVVEVMCMGCEAAIAREATDADRNAAHERALQAPSRVDACPPSPSGLGGTVGPVLSRLR